MPGIFEEPSIDAQGNEGVKLMPNYRFAVIVAADPMSYEETLDAADALGEAGCTDASIRGHREGMELLFERTAISLQAAIASAIADVESAAYRVVRVEMEPGSIPTQADSAGKVGPARKKPKGHALPRKRR
jgi:hypothetical protein